MSLSSLLLWALLFGAVVVIIFRIRSENSFKESDSSTGSPFVDAPDLCVDADDSTGGAVLSHPDIGHGHAGSDVGGHHDCGSGDFGGHDCGGHH
jgi:hypothetical protein